MLQNKDHNVTTPALILRSFYVPIVPLADSTVSEQQQQSQSPKKPPSQGEESHDIRDHLCKLHKQRRSVNPEAAKTERIKLLRKVLRKL